MKKTILRTGVWFLTLCTVMMLLMIAPTAQAARAGFDVYILPGVHGGYMTVSIKVNVVPASPITLDATLTRDDDSVMRTGRVFSNPEGAESLTIEFQLPISQSMTGTEYGIHISCEAEANGQTYAWTTQKSWEIIHNFIENQIDPTCSQPGYYRRTCSICGFVDDMSVPIDTSRHDWGPWISNNDGTCTRTCRYNPAHTETKQEEWSPWQSNGDGTHTRVSLVSPARQTELCDYKDVIIDPVCTEAGFTTHVCRKCSYSYDDSPVQPLGHDWGLWISNSDGTHTRICKRNPEHKKTENCSFVDTAVPPTCMEPGYTTHRCSLCSCEYIDQTVPPLLHDWGPWTSNSDGTHTRTCKRDPSHIETENCRMISQDIEPTCTEEGYTDYTCAVCGYGYQDMIVPAMGHQAGEWMRILEPTRYAAGREEQHCRVCSVLMNERVVPKLSGMRYGNTACIDGLRFRDSVPGLTDKWYSYAVIDLEKEGTTEYPLVASNSYRIGVVFVRINQGELTVHYQFSISKYNLREEFLTCFPSLKTIRTLDTKKLSNYAFDRPMRLSDVPQENGKTILFMRLLLNYDSFDKGVSPR